MIIAKTINATPANRRWALPCGAKYVAFHGSDHQRETDANGKCHRHACRVDRDHQEDIRNVEQNAAEDGGPDRASLRGVEIFEKRHSGSAGIAKREREEHRECEHADRVVPVEELKRPAIFAGQFLRVRPRTPAQHGDDAKQDGQTKIVNDEHAERQYSSAQEQPNWPQMNTDQRRFGAKALSVSIRVYPWPSLTLQYLR
jgi:hypothetical protein